MKETKEKFDKELYALLNKYREDNPGLRFNIKINELDPNRHYVSKGDRVRFIFED